MTTLSSACQNCRRAHPAVVFDYKIFADHWDLDFCLCRSFSSEADPIAFVDGLTDAEKERLLPVPYSGSTTKGFGAPLTFGNYDKTSPVCVPNYSRTRVHQVQMWENYPKRRAKLFFGGEWEALKTPKL